jgi:hypothetical protein
VLVGRALGVVERWPSSQESDPDWDPINVFRRALDDVEAASADYIAPGSGS